MLKIDLFLNSLFTRSRENCYIVTFLSSTFFLVWIVLLEFSMPHLNVEKNMWGIFIKLTFTTTGDNGFCKFSLKEPKLVYAGKF